MSPKGNGPYALLLLVLLAVDQASKAVVARTVALHQSITVIPGFLDITRVHNKGAIFGSFSRVASPAVRTLLMAASLVALGFVLYYFFKTPAADRLMKVALTLIAAGAVGNLFDRVVRGYVIDFVDAYVGRAHWPAFNAADSCISIGAVLMAVILFRRRPGCIPSS